MLDFFQQYFVEPIVTQGVAGYNIFNTPVYAALFAIAVFGTWKLLKRLDIRINRAFLIGILPFILSGGVWRVVRDSKLVESPWLVTPLIYFVIFVAAIVGLLVSVWIERLLLRTKIVNAKGKNAQFQTNKKMDRISSSYTDSFVPSSYYKIWFIIGLIFLLYGLFLLVPLGVQNLNALGIIAALSVVWVVILYGFHKFSKRVKAFAVFTKQNSALLWAHMFDASTTFTALQFFAESGYYEQHVVSGAVIDAFGPVGQFVLKLVVLIPVLWLLDRELAKREDAQLRGFIKIAILILGLALGVRNGLRLGLGI